MILQAGESLPFLEILFDKRLIGKVWSSQADQGRLHPQKRTSPVEVVDVQQVHKTSLPQIAGCGHQTKESL